MPPIQGGVWPAMLTPVTDAGEPNPEMIESIVNVLIDDGLDGLYLLGSTGQGPAFSVEQRKRVAEIALKAVSGRVPTIVHVGCVSALDSMELARHAESFGTDGISSVPPIYYASGQEVVFEHYSRIGASTGLPFFPYHHPMFGEAALADPNYTDQLMEIPNIAGMKVTVRDLYIIGLIQQRTGGKLQLFSGADELICHAAVSGVIGAIGSFYNLWGPACKQARQAFVAGDFDRGKSFMANFQSILDQVLRSGSPFGFLRVAMRLKYGVEIGAGRGPMSLEVSPWNDDEVRELVARLDETG